MKGRTHFRGRPGWKPEGEMNKTEQRFAELLFARKADGEIIAYWYEPMTLTVIPGIGKIRRKTTYRPDFLIAYADGTLELVDVKGGRGWEDDARVKIKAAADRYPCFRFVGMTWKGGRWTEERFN